MTKTLQKKHWYDGWIYSKIIDTSSIPFRYEILDFIHSSNTVLDVGCGTGGFTLELANYCQHIVGIDISKKQIDCANKKLKNTNQTNIEYKHIHAAHISTQIKDKFDYAIFTFMLHEISQKERLNVLKEISSIANSIIILEYHVPHPLNIWGLGSRTIEFFAGWDHFTNFLDFKKRGGIKSILKEAGFEIINEKINNKKIFNIVVAKKY